MRRPATLRPRSALDRGDAADGVGDAGEGDYEAVTHDVHDRAAV
jgi:hypothetical protein